MRRAMQAQNRSSGAGGGPDLPSGSSKGGWEKRQPLEYLQMPRTQSLQMLAEAGAV
jgi:hypothetical protein